MRAERDAAISRGSHSTTNDECAAGMVSIVGCWFITTRLRDEAGDVNSLVRRPRPISRIASRPKRECAMKTSLLREEIDRLRCTKPIVGSSEALRGWCFRQITKVAPYRFHGSHFG